MPGRIVFSPFSPHHLVRNPHVQSVLASSRLRLRRLGALGVRAGARALLLDCGGGARLQAFHTPAAGGPASRVVPDLAILVHGWEGCVDSTYMLSTGEILHRAGVEVVRLNLRDHGATHELNEGIFHANLVDEVVGAVAALARDVPHRRLTLLGFSLGGSFALRAALRAPEAGVALDHVVAVNPALHPPSIVEAIDRSRLYRPYFLRRWRRSLAAKQRAFPGRYDFREALRLRTVLELTEAVIPLHTPFRSAAEYFAGYTLSDGRLAALDVPATILTAADDPLVRVDEFRALPETPALRVEIQARGGHCGYIEGPTLRSWLERRMLQAVIEGPARTVRRDP